jgi:hypothetical protein
MDAASSSGGSPDPAASEEEMGVAERAPRSGHELQNGHGRNPAGEAEAGTAGGHAELEGGQAQAHAEELLSRAHAHAELLRAHAEALRAEAASLRAEAAALRRAAQDGAAGANARAEALVVQMQAAADELRVSMQGQAEEIRAEIEGARAEAESLRRLLRAETDAALADAQRLRAEVQAFRAEIHQLSTELHLLSARATGDAEPGALDRHFPDLEGPETGSRVETHHDPDHALPVGDLRERFRRIWEGTHAEATGDPSSVEQPADTLGVPRASEPLIGSGGWRAPGATSSPAPVEDGGAGEPSAPPPGGSHRRRFGRPR